ncbi:hypothetical protein ACLWBD_05845 [Bdellovibrio sp. HCB117]|uniref:hypothetical protein n=1 Tax=Bdellovibrio sp. HCB117 TaxID=3394359 RepID=UPI0039B3E7B2
MKWKSDQKIHIDLKPPEGKITCDFTDELETISVRSYEVTVTYGGPHEEVKTCRGKIADFVTENKIEYMVMSDGTKIPQNAIRRISSE